MVTDAGGTASQQKPPGILTGSPLQLDDRGREFEQTPPVEAREDFFGVKSRRAACGVAQIKSSGSD